MRIFKKFFDPGLGEGGGGVTEVAPVETVDIVQPPVEVPNEAPAEVQSEAPAETPLQALGEEGSVERRDWFNDLSYEDRVKVEQGDFEEKPPEEEIQEQENTELEEDSAALPGDKPVEPVEEKPPEMTEEMFSSLDENTQNYIKYLGNELKAADGEANPDGLADLEYISKDPLIQARLEEMRANGGDVNSVPKILQDKQFDVNDAASQEDIEALGLDLEENPNALQGVSNMLQKAYSAGAKKAEEAAQYDVNNAAKIATQQATAVNELNGLTGRLAATDPAMKAAFDSKLDVMDPSHPMQKFMEWGADNLTQHFMDEVGYEAGYAAFQQATGGLSKTMKTVATNARDGLIKSLENLKTGPKTVGKATTSKDVSVSQNNLGIDTDRYLTDPTYQRSVYNSAKTYDARRQLEILSTTGKLPG